VIDTSFRTSWFSAGGDNTTLTWTSTTFEEIVEVDFAGNEQHPEFPTEFGFEGVTIQLIKAGVVVAQQSFSLAGTPDPAIFWKLPSPVVADQVRFVFSGPESTDCGGFSEMRVLALR
jgi:hypothetical protein